MDLLIFTDTVSDPDPAIDSKCPKRGDVIAANPDGFSWGVGELKNTCFRIINVAGISDAQAGALLTPEPGDPSLNDRLLWHYFKLDIDNSSLPSAFTTWIADTTRATPSFALDLATITNITVQKVSEPTG